MVYTLSHNVENQSTHEKMGGKGRRGISSIIYIKNGLYGMFDIKRDFLLQEH